MHVSFHPGIRGDHFQAQTSAMLFFCLKKLNVLDQWHDGSIYWAGQMFIWVFSLRSYRDQMVCGQPNTWEVPREGTFSIILAWWGLGVKANTMMDIASQWEINLSCCQQPRCQTQGKLGKTVVSPLDHLFETSNDIRSIKNRLCLQEEMFLNQYTLSSNLF